LSAASNGHVECVREILTSDPICYDYETEDGYTPLMAAIRRGCIDSVYYLLLAGCDINSCTRNKGYTPLIIACKYNRYEIIAVLLKNEANFDCRTCDGDSPLMIACKMGYVGAVDTLLKWGGIKDINYTKPNGVNALFIAFKYSRLPIVEILLCEGALITDFIIKNMATNRYYQQIIDNEISRRSRRVNFDKFISNNIEHHKYRNLIYNQCFPDGDYRVIKYPIIGWINAEKLMYKCYYNEILFILHLYIAKVNSEVPKDTTVLASNVVDNLSRYSNKTYRLMSILAVTLYEFII